MTSNSSLYLHQKDNKLHHQEKSTSKTYQRYIHDSPISKLVTLNQSNANVGIPQAHKANTKNNSSHSKDHQKQIEQIRQRYKNINVRSDQIQKQNKFDCQQRKRTIDNKNYQYEEQFQRIQKNSQLICKRQREMDAILINKKILQQKPKQQQKRSKNQEVKKSYLQRISEASNSNYETFRQSCKQESYRGRAVSHQNSINLNMKSNQQKSYQNYKTSQLKKIKEQLQRREKKLENLRNQERLYQRTSDISNKYGKQIKEGLNTPKKEITYTNNNYSQDVESPWFRHASSIYNESYQNSDKKYSPNQISNRFNCSNQNYIFKNAVTEQQSTIKNSMKSTLLSSNQKNSSISYRDNAKVQIQMQPKVRKVTFEDQSKIKQIQNKIKQRENEFRIRQEQLKQKYAKVSNLRIHNNYQHKINQFKLNDKQQERPDKKQSSINLQIQNIQKKIKQFQSMKKKLNIEFQPYKIENHKIKANEQLTNGSKHERSVSVYDKQIRKNVNNQENLYQKLKSEKQFTKPKSGQKRCSFIQNTKPMYSQLTLNNKQCYPSNTKNSNFAFQLFRIQSQTQESSSNISNISRIPSSADLPSRSPSQKYLNHIQIQNKADGGIEQRKKKLQPKVQSNHYIKQLVSLLSQQTILDEQFRNTKIWFSTYNSTNKWKQLKYALREKGLNFTAFDDKILEFNLTEDENNPFFSINQHSKFSIQYMIDCYEKCQDHWRLHIKGKFKQEELSAQNFTQRKFDLDKKGYIVIEDLVRFLNIESGTFYRNRDLVLIARRLGQGKGQNISNNEELSIQFRSIMTCLTNKI